MASIGSVAGQYTDRIIPTGLYRPDIMTMKHDWQELRSTQQEVCKYGWEPRRRCSNCGKIQQRIAQTSWGRVQSYRWLPLIGRCKPSRDIDL